VYVSGVRSTPTGYYDTPTANQTRTNEARAWDISPVTSRTGRIVTQGHPNTYDSDDERLIRVTGNIQVLEALQAHYTQEDESSGEEYTLNDADAYFFGESSPMAPLSPLPIPTVPTPPSGDGPDDYQGDGGSESSSSLYHFDGESSSPWQSDSEDQLSEDGGEDSDGQDERDEGGALASIPITVLTQTRQHSEPPISIVAARARKNYHYSHHHHHREENDEEEPEPAQPPMSFIFSTTEFNAYLFPTAFLSPTVVCSSFLQQPFPPALQYLRQVDRLNMALPIPELSLVIVASQQGRVAVFRLTRSGDNFGMRLDTVLPRERGEVEMDLETRPAVALLGIAVSPVQGKEMGKSRAGSDSGYGVRKRKERQRGGGWRGVEGRRRWRLMMVYMDGSVLSYELGRETEEEGPGGLGDLLGLDGFVMV